MKDKLTSAGNSAESVRCCLCGGHFPCSCQSNSKAKVLKWHNNTQARVASNAGLSCMKDSARKRLLYTKA